MEKYIHVVARFTDGVVWCETCLHGDCSVITGDGNSCTVTTVRRSRRLFVLVTDISEPSLIQRRHLMSVEK